MITFAEVREGEEFVRNERVYMKVPEMKTSIGKCHVCGKGMNAITIGRKDGAPLTYSSGRPVLPWHVHFCPSEKVERLSLSAWEVNARRWLENAINAR